MEKLVIACLCCVMPVLYFALHRVAGQQRPDRLAQFREQLGQALAEPFKGVTTDGKVIPGLFGVRHTGVSTKPVREAADAFLNGLSEEQRKKTMYPADDPEWRSWDNRHFPPRQGVDHERALLMMRECHYLSGNLSVSRFNRRLHQCREWLEVGTEVLCEVATRGEVFIIDSLPIPVCQRVRARRCRKVRGVDYCGYCAAKKEKFFGFRLHLICNAAGAPVSYDLIAARFHDLTPVHDLALVLPPTAKLFGDKGYISEDDAQTIEGETGVRVIAARRKNMRPLEWIDEYELKQYRKGIETRNSQLEKMGIERLYARTNTGFEIKVHASVFALSITTLN